MGACLILTSGVPGVKAEDDASAAPWSANATITGLLATRYQAVWNVNPALDRPDDRNDSKALGYLTTTLTVRPVRAIEGVLTLASREVSRETVDDGTVDDRWATTRFIDEAWIKASRGSAWLKAGKQRLVIGRGLVLDSYQPAVSGNWNVTADTPGLRVKAFGARLDQDGALRRGQSLYGGARVDVSHPTAGRLSFSVSRLWDRDALIPALLPTAVSIGFLNFTNPFQADDGSLTYWIVDGARDSGPWSMTGLAVVETGEIRGTLNGATPHAITLFGAAAELAADYEVSDHLTLRAMGLYTSGDGSNPRDVAANRRYDAFVGIFPLIDATNLFFNGGIDSSFVSGTPGASGVLGRGVFAGILTAMATIDRTTLRVVAADLWSDFPSTDGGGRHYGVEFDTEGAYAVTEWLTARLEGDVLFPGSFYQSSTLTTVLDSNPDPVYKLAIGLDVAW